jgi:hypothetical protein
MKKMYDVFLRPDIKEIYVYTEEIIYFDTHIKPNKNYKNAVNLYLVIPNE